MNVKNLNIMKAMVMVLLMVPFWAVNGLARQHEIDGLLKNQESRTMVFNTVLSDHQLMGNMMDMCEKGSTQCVQMTRVMSDHPHMMMMGMQKIREKGNCNIDESMHMKSKGDTTESGHHHMHK